MFGKRSKLSDTQKFVIAKGREVGNLKAAGKPFNKGAAPLKTSSGAEVRGKAGPNPYRARGKTAGQ